MLDTMDGINAHWRLGLLSRSDVCGAALRIVERLPSAETVSRVLASIERDVQVDVTEYLRSLSTARAEEVFWIGSRCGGPDEDARGSAINPATIAALSAYFGTREAKRRSK